MSCSSASRDKIAQRTSVLAVHEAEPGLAINQAHFADQAAFGPSTVHGDRV